MTARPYGWMRARRRRYGDVFSSRFPFFGRVVYIADPAEVKRVFTGDPAIFHAGEANLIALGDVLGEHSLLTLDEGATSASASSCCPHSTARACAATPS